MTGNPAAPLLTATAPLSVRAVPGEVAVLARELLALLGIEARCRVVETDASGCLAAESWFRREWWRAGSDPFRRTLQTEKWQAHAAPGRAAAVTAAWRDMQDQVASDVWRSELRRATGGDTTSGPFVRRLFRAAQQTWTRAARWDAAAPDQSRDRNPFRAAAALFSRGAWPLGMYDGEVWVVLSTGGAGVSLPVPPPLSCGSPACRVLYASAEFRGCEAIDVLAAAARESGWELVHNHVDENAGAPEFLLGQQLSACAGVVALCDEDVDFGLPWWVFQEIDYAEGCGKRCLRLRPPFASRENIREIESWVRTL